MNAIYVLFNTNHHNFCHRSDTVWIMYKMQISQQTPTPFLCDSTNNVGLHI